MVGGELGSTVEAADGIFFVREEGPRTAPVILGLHSLFLNGTMFDSFAREADSEFRVIRPDFRGQGSSSPATTDVVTMDDCAADMSALLDALGIEKCQLLAQSMGGDVAFRLALMRPDVVTSIVVLGSSACAEPADQLADFREWVAGVERQGFSGEVLDYTMRIMLGETCRSDPHRRSVVEWMRQQLESLDEGLLPAMRGVVERPGVVERLREIDVPVLIVSGEEDMPRPPAWSQEMHKALPNSELWSMECVGHSPILERPDTVIPRLLDFYHMHA